jgi:hypothetical protein
VDQGHSVAKRERERKEKSGLRVTLASLLLDLEAPSLVCLFFFFLLFAARALKETRCALVFESPFCIVSPDVDAIAKLRWS